jgi:hypothetical protein
MFAEEGSSATYYVRDVTDIRKKDEGIKSRVSPIKNILSVGGGCYNTKRLFWFNGRLNNCFELTMLSCKFLEQGTAL